MVTQYLNATGEGVRAAVRRAVRALGEGGLVAIPTDTVYGLAVRADDEAAVQRLFEVKRRPDNNPLPILLPNAEALDGVCSRVPDLARVLGRAFWPGPLTIVVPRAPQISDAVTAGRDTVGVRVPDHPVAIAVLAGCDFLVAVTSANISTRDPAREPEQVRREFSGLIGVILAADRCPGGVPSTVVDATKDQPAILRAGAVTAARIGEALRAEQPGSI